MKISKSQSLNVVFWLVLASVLITEFNNCGDYAQPASYLTASSVSCDNSVCVTPNINNLSIQANLAGGGSEYGVPANLIEWNLGGDCNEGGYNSNVITWELYLNGTKVRDSNMAGMLMASPTSTVNSQCVNGRFSLYLNMQAISGDPINRTGLANGQGGRAAYDLYINIYGRDSASGALQSNSLTGRTHVSLLAI